MKRLIALAFMFLSITACGSFQTVRYPAGTNSAAVISRLELDLLKAHAKKYYVAAAREMRLSEGYVQLAREERARRRPEPRVLANLEYAQRYYEQAVMKNLSTGHLASW